MTGPDDNKARDELARKVEDTVHSEHGKTIQTNIIVKLAVEYADSRVKALIEQMILDMHEVSYRPLGEADLLSYLPTDNQERR